MYENQVISHRQMRANACADVGNFLIVINNVSESCSNRAGKNLGFLEKLFTFFRF